MQPFRLLIALVGLIFSFSLSAQVDLTPERFDFEPELRVKTDLQTPAEFLGYELGEEFTIYARAADYFNYLADNSDRITINQYGETYEGRPLYNLVISSARNQGRMEELRQKHLTLMEANASQANEIIENEPVFLSFSYNIHGNEASCTEAALQLAYRMAAAEDSETAEVLNDAVIIIYVCINPDGRDRYVYWYNGMRRNTGGEEPRDLEHYPPWPNGRTNHYWFDLNRDWIWQVHPESKGHSGEYLRWMPQIHVDYHEQGYNANYFTSPGTTPRNLLLPDEYEAWSDVFGRANIAEFDKYGLSYFTRDRFDFFYPSYGSSYPSVLGAIGMLTEQGGITAGRAVETEDGYVLTLRQRVFDHYTTSWASIKAGAKNRAELLRYSYDAWNPANAKSNDKAYVIRANDDVEIDGNTLVAPSGYLADFVEVMLRNNIRVERANSDFRATAKSFKDNNPQATSFKANDIIIRADQPLHLLIHTVLGRNMEIEDSVMYDMSTWSAPIAYNLDAYTLETVPSVVTDKIESVSFAGQVIGNNSSSTYAYVIDWAERNAPKALAKLWEKGYRVRSALGAIKASNASFSAGSLIVLRGKNLEKAENMPRDMASLATEVGVRVHAFDTGRMVDGHDLANPRHRPVTKPKVAMLIEPPFSTYTAGQVYYLFDWETQMPIERVRTSTLRQTALPNFGQRYGPADLNNYDVLILPGGGGGLPKLFTKKEQAMLTAWLQSGGTIVAMESAANFFTKDGKFNKLEVVKAGPDTSEAAKTVSYEKQEYYRGLKRIPGSAMLATIDQSHPLGFGLEKELYTLTFGSQSLANSIQLESVGRYFKDADKLLVAGYASEENLNRLAGNTFAGVLPVGSGQIVYLMDNPHYRMFWRGPSRMMQNAVMLLPGF